MERPCMYANKMETGIYVETDSLARYNAPEVSKQKVTPIDRANLHKCDIWAYGLLVWELLAGGSIYFKKSWRHDPAFARSTIDSLSGLSRTDSHASGVTSGEWTEDSIQPEDEGVLGKFDTRHLRNLAKQFVNSHLPPSSSFEKSYLRPLFDRTLQEDPAERLSDLTRLPIIGVWNSAGVVSLQSKLAMHMGTSEFTFDMFRPDLGREILWEHQKQMLQDFERVANQQQVSSLAAPAAFQTALCYSMGFGIPIDHSKAAQYLRKATETQHPLSRFFNQRLLSVLTRLPTSQMIDYTDLIIEGYQALRIVNRFAQITFHATATSSARQDREPIGFSNFSDFRLYAERLMQLGEDVPSYRASVAGGTPRMTFLEMAIAFEDVDLTGSLLKVTPLSTVNAWGETALIQACRLGNVDIVKLLLAAGADPCQASEDGCTVFHWLFCLGRDIQQIEDSLFSFLPAQRSLLDQPCSTVRVLHPQWPLQLSGSPLAFAVTAGSMTAVDTLLRHGANPRAPAFKTSEEGISSTWTAMHLAVKYHFPKILNVLVNACDVVKRRALPLRTREETLSSNVPDAAIQSMVIESAIRFPLLPLPCVLSYIAPVERYGIHGNEYQERLSGIIDLLPLKCLEWTSSDGQTPLMQAIDFEDYDTVSLLLDRQPALAAKAFREPTENGAYTYPLHFAAQIGSRRDTEDSLRIVNCIHSAHSDAIWDRDSRLRTALHMSVTGISSRITQWLIDKGSRVHDVDKDGQSPLHVVRSLPNMIALLDAGASIDHTDKDGFAAVHCAVLAGAENMLLELVKRDANLGACNNKSGTPLHCAVLKKSKGALSILLQKHPPLNARNKDGKTSLFLAVESGRNDLVQMLLDAGADPTIGDNDGLTPIQAAVKSRSPNIVEKLLKHGRRIDEPNFMSSLLHLCTAEGDPVSLKIVLESCIARNLYDVNALEATSQTPLHTAASFARADMATILLNYGAAINAQAPDGATPLLLACQSDEKDVARHGGNRAELCALLLSRGADHLIRDFNGWTPWMFARVSEDFALMTCLLEHTADSLSRIGLCEPGCYAEVLHPCPPDTSLIEIAIRKKEWDFVTMCIGKSAVSLDMLPSQGGFGYSETTKLCAYAKRGDKEMIEWRLSESYHRFCGYSLLDIGKRNLHSEWHDVKKDEDPGPYPEPTPPSLPQSSQNKPKPSNLSQCRQQ
jgi:ankyrin repeat protein